MQICYNTLFKMSSFQQQEKNDTYKKKTGNYDSCTGDKKKKAKGTAVSVTLYWT